MQKKSETSLSRVEKHLLRPSSPYYSMLSEYCHLAKNLYNQANYLIRDAFIKDGKWLRYNELDKQLKRNTEYSDYRAMPTAQSAQQVLRLLDKNWKSFFSAIKDWKKNKEKYLGRPKLPKYKAKDSRSILILTNQNCKYIDGKIRFPKSFRGFETVPEFAGLLASETDIERKNQRIFDSFQQVRFIPDGTDIVMEIVYTIKKAPKLVQNGKYAGIDIGVDNMVAMAMNIASAPVIINGRIPKSINQYYNKKIAEMKSICKQMTGNYSSAKIRRFSAKRNRKITDYMHKASRLVIDRCLENNIRTIVIGQNKEWKQSSKLSAKVNQHFVQLPFAELIQMIEYKAEEHGIAVVLTEESYTSGTSFLDKEPPVKEYYNKRRRVHRGLFRANDGRLINADINGAFQIMKKVFPDVTADGIEGVVLRPVTVVAA